MTNTLTRQTHPHDKHIHMTNTLMCKTHYHNKQQTHLHNKHTHTALTHKTHSKHSHNKHTRMTNIHTTDTQDTKLELPVRTHHWSRHHRENGHQQHHQSTHAGSHSRVTWAVSVRPSEPGTTGNPPHPDSPWKQPSQTKSLACLPPPDSPWKHSQVKSNQVTGMSATPRQSLEIQPNQVKPSHIKTVPGNTAKSDQVTCCPPHQDSPCKHIQIKSNQVTYSPPHQDSPWKHSQIKPGNTSSQLYRMESLKTFSSNQAASESQTKSCCIKLHPQVKPSCIRKSNQVTLHKVASISQTKWSCIQKSNQVKSNLAPSVEEELFLRPLNHDKHVLSEHNQHWKYIQSGVKVKNTSNLQVKYR